MPIVNLAFGSRSFSGRLPVDKVLFAVAMFVTAMLALRRRTVVLSPRRILLGVMTICVTALCFATGAIGVTTSEAAAATATPKPTSSPAAPAPTSVPQRATYGIGPATKGLPDKRSFFSYTTAATGVVSDSAIVVNYALAPIDLNINADDLISTTDGSISVPSSDVKPVGAGTWISFPENHTKIHVPAATSTGPGTYLIHFTMRAPFGASAGDHSAAIVVGLVTTGLNPKGQNVNLEQQVGTRIYMRLRGAVHPAVSVSDLDASYISKDFLGSGEAKLTYKVTNTGNVNFGVTQSASVSGWFGDTAHATPADIDLLLPGATATITVTIPNVTPAFVETATVSVKTKHAPEADLPSFPSASASTTFFAVNWLIVLIIVVVLLLLFLLAFWLFWLRPRRAKRAAVASGSGTNAASHRASNDRASNDGKGDEGATKLCALCSVVFVVISGFLLQLAHSGAALAVTVPYTDPSAMSAIGLCDSNGHTVTSGSVNTTPFVWRAVASAPVPGVTTAKGVTAILTAYQPRPNTPADQWSGDTLTATTTYTNPNYPMAQATSKDFSLSDFIGEYPPMMNGFLQLRLYFATAKGVMTTSYAATDIQVTGSTWTVVRGATVACDQGSAISVEAALASKQAAASTTASHAASASATPSGRSAAPTTTVASSTSATALASAGSSTGAMSSSLKTSTASRSPDKGGTAVAVIAVVAAVVLAGGVAGALLLRRRARSQPTS